MKGNYEIIHRQCDEAVCVTDVVVRVTLPEPRVKGWM
jgi:hypothetical protein